MSTSLLNLDTQCVICSSSVAAASAEGDDGPMSILPTLASSTPSENTRLNSLRNDDVYPPDILSESFCNFLQLSPLTFKDRLTQENISICKSCARSVQRIHVVLNQIKTLRSELNQVKGHILNWLQNDKLEPEGAKRRGKNLTPTAVLRNDIAKELKKISRCRLLGNTAENQTDDHEFDLPSSPTEGFSTERVSKIVVAAGTIVGDVFKEEIVGDDSHGAFGDDEEDSFFQEEDFSSTIPASPSSTPPVTRLRRKRSKSASTAKAKPAKKKPRILVKFSTPKEICKRSGNKPLTPIVKLDKLSEDYGSKLRNRAQPSRTKLKPFPVSPEGGDYHDGDEEWILPDSVNSKSASKKRTRIPSSEKRQMRSPNSKTKSEYLKCPKENCNVRIAILDGDLDAAKLRQDAHVKKFHEGVKLPFSCSHCPKAFKAWPQYVEHNRIHTGEVPFICETCGKPYRTGALLKSHSKVHVENRERNFSCSTCPDKFFDVISLNAHQLTHTKERAFICELCPEKFLRKPDLQNHQRFAHFQELGLEQFKCRFCGKVLGRKSHLLAHEKAHTKDGEFKCRFCDYRSTTKGRVATHEKAHTAERKYKCDECEGIAYKHAFQLVIHKRIHSGERPYKCKFCGNAYKAYAHLYQHEQTHAQTLNHKCSFCGQGFVIRKYLLRHEERHRNGKLQRKRKWTKATNASQTTLPAEEEVETASAGIAEKQPELGSDSGPH